MSQLPVTVVLRTAGERTAELAIRIVESQIPSANLVVIREVPFARAVERTFEIAIEREQKWTIGMDADVLLCPDALNILVDAAERETSTLFELEACVFDKVFGGPRWCGVHLYNTTYLGRALEIARTRTPSHRPESSIFKVMQHEGLLVRLIPNVIGVHDFEQSFIDLFRKGCVHAQKHRKELSIFESTWEELSDVDDDFKALVAGVEYGKSLDGVALTDIRAFGSEVMGLLSAIGLEEKAAMAPDNSEIDVPRMLESAVETPAFRCWLRSKTAIPMWQRALQHPIGAWALSAIPERFKRLLRPIMGLPDPTSPEQSTVPF